MKILYGMPTSGKSRALKLGLRGIDTDHVRKAFAFRKHDEDAKIFSKTVSILADLEGKTGIEWFLVTNLVAQVNLHLRNHPDTVTAVYCLETPSREVMIDRLCERDGLTRKQAEDLLDAWQVKHQRDPVYPSSRSHEITILKDNNSIDELVKEFQLPWEV